MLRRQAIYIIIILHVIVERSLNSFLKKNNSFIILITSDSPHLLFRYFIKYALL